jgi:hypothetical protein
MKFEVVSNIYEWNETGLHGALHIELDGCPYPKQRWSGSVSEMLIMWAENLFGLFESGSSGEEEFFFLDSSLSFTVRKNGVSLATLRLLQNAKPTNDPPFEVSFYCIVSAVFRLIEGLVCDERFEGVQQIRRLKNIAERLKKTAETHGFHME